MRFVAIIIFPAGRVPDWCLVTSVIEIKVYIISTIFDDARDGDGVRVIEIGTIGWDQVVVAVDHV